MKIIHAAMLLGMASFGTIATAQVQDTTPPPEAADPAVTPDTATPAPEAASAISDVEVQQYASALVAIDEVQRDTATAEADKQQQMVAKVQESGLAPERFNEITQASQSDLELQQRIQVAMSSAAPTAM